ncbi:hypothetical protein N7461_002614 [Penicillium sp. DV-2018c]|nr:hypothetical protein N7461_002614 [Penicillium sp. DV-2018c]
MVPPRKRKATDLSTNNRASKHQARPRTISRSYTPEEPRWVLDTVNAQRSETMWGPSASPAGFVIEPVRDLPQLPRSTGQEAQRVADELSKHRPMIHLNEAVYERC